MVTCSLVPGHLPGNEARLLPFRCAGGRVHILNPLALRSTSSYLKAIAVAIGTTMPDKYYVALALAVGVLLSSLKADAQQ